MPGRLEWLMIAIGAVVGVIAAVSTFIPIKLPPEIINAIAALGSPIAAVLCVLLARQAYALIKARRREGEALKRMREARSVIFEVGTLGSFTHSMKTPLVDKKSVMRVIVKSIENPREGVTIE